MRAGCGSNVTATDLRISRVSTPHNLVENGTVSAMHSVEIADADNRRPEVVRNIVEFVEKSHPNFVNRAETPKAPEPL